MLTRITVTIVKVTSLENTCAKDIARTKTVTLIMIVKSRQKNNKDPSSSLKYSDMTTYSSKSIINSILSSSSS